mgnify:CR=1 FL=1
MDVSAEVSGTVTEILIKNVMTFADEVVVEQDRRDVGRLDRLQEVHELGGEHRVLRREGRVDEQHALEDGAKPSSTTRF